MANTTQTPTSEIPLPSKFVGATLAVVGNMFISIAINIQKHAHNQLAGTGKRYITSLMWWCGMLIIGLGEFGNFAAYGFAPAALVAPLGSSGVIANAVLAVVFLKEKLRVRDVIGIILAIAGGCVLVTFSSSTESSLLTADEVLSNVKQIPYIIYVIIEITMLIFIIYLHHFKKYTSVVTILLQVALLGSFTVIAAKAIASMIRITFSGNNQLVYPVFYVMVVVLVVSIIGQIKYLNEAMSLFDATVVMPINFILFTISAISSGIVFYRELYQLTVMEVGMTLFGAVLSFIGVYLISGGREEEKVDENTGLLNDETTSNNYDVPYKQMEDVSAKNPDISLSSSGELATDTVSNNSIPLKPIRHPAIDTGSNPRIE